MTVVASQAADPDRVAALRDAGADVLVAETIDAALSELGRGGITSLFLEGGRTLAAAFAEADQIDEARVFVAPILLAGGRRVPVDPGAADTLIETRFREW